MSEMTTDDLDMNESDDGELVCRPGGNYGLCRTHPTCEMVHEKLKKAEAFKKWTHDWLDAVGVPHDPDPEHTAANGCRISGRMRFLLGRMETAEAEVARLEALVESLAARCVGQSELLTRKVEAL
jgi:hypothetical protein